ncbi:MAG TPA: quinolinate synthase NadA [Solirubrobacteraceae bacterium]|nr:quinolinate synthase NadA [Solirubrobacteraceae bacterium]
MGVDDVGTAPTGARRSPSLRRRARRLKHVAERPDGDFIVATETGMLHPLHKAAPRARLIAANPKAGCKYMKMIPAQPCGRSRRARAATPAGGAPRPRARIGGGLRLTCPAAHPRRLPAATGSGVLGRGRCATRGAPARRTLPARSRRPRGR